MVDLKNTAHLKYRGDIDGLRAVSILLVILFHAFPKELPGGFLGVDVFFCISGFLISGIIMNGLDREQFSFVDFYNRRAKRIFPNLALVLVASLGIGWFVLLPSEFRAVGKNTFGGAFFVSNIFRMLEIGYFDVTANLKPLLHLWSLAVEEQFYLILPVLLFAINEWGKRWNAVVIFALIVLSFLVNLEFVSSHPAFTFFSLPTRGWELLLGVILQTAMREKKENFAKIPDILGWVALATLVAASFFFNANLRYPGAWAMIPVGATLLILATGHRPTGVGRALSARPLIYLGKISFSLYLWHWILLAYARISFAGNVTDIEAGIILIVATGLSAVTYEFWENPIRKSQNQRAIRFAWASLLTIGVLGGVIWSEKAMPRMGTRGKFIEQALEENGGTFAPQMDIIGGQLNIAKIDGATEETVILIGDSLMAQYYATAEALAKRQPARIRDLLFITKFGCTPLPGIEMNRVKDCDVFVRETRTFTQKNHVAAVVFSSAWAGFLEPGAKLLPGTSTLNLVDDETDEPIRVGTPEYKKVHDDLASWMRSLVKRGIKVHIVLPNPEGKVLSPRNAISRLTFKYMPEEVPKAPILSSQQQTRDTLKEVARQSGAKIIDPFEFLCTETDCAVRLVSGEYVYSDGIHIQGDVLRNKIRYLDEIFLRRE